MKPFHGSWASPGHQRRLRRGVLLSLLCVMAVATSAAGECAWVTWQQHTYRHTRAEDWEWTPIAAYQTRSECQEQAQAKVAEWLKSRATKLAENVVKFEEGALLTARVLCLPDTADPRGPKGK